MSGTKTELYTGKSTEYYSHLRLDVAELVPEGNNRILDVGCGRGTLLAYLRESGKASLTVGVDILESEPPIDRYFRADIETFELPYPPGYFDVIICADVLEHLIFPWNTLQRLVRLLRRGGTLIASIPNIRHVKVLAQIALKGTFRYTDEGILDRTHLRFFCKRDMIELMRQAGLRVERIHYHLRGKALWANRITLGVLEEFLVVQYLLLCRQ